MSVSEILFVRAQPWLRTNVRDITRIVVPILALAVVWWFAVVPLSGIALLGLVGYAAINLVLLVLLRRARAHRRDTQKFPLFVTSIVSDLLFALWFVGLVNPLSLGVMSIYAIFGLKALRYRRYFLWFFLAPILLGPVGLFTLYSQTQVVDTTSVTALAIQSVFVLGTLAFVGSLLTLSDYRFRAMQQLAATLEQQQATHKERVVELESVNTDLRVHIRRQQALEESLRVVTNSLSLDDVLSQILDSMMHMFGTTRVSAAALTLLSDDSFTHRTLSLDLGANTCWAEPLAKRVVQEREPVVVHDALQEREWRDIYRCGAISALSVPLIDVDGLVQGALTIVSTQRQAFTPAETRHMTSFSIQASVAIHNAELHSQLTRQGVMLEAVLRDINDGLLVLDHNSLTVLANPVAHQALQHSESLGVSLRKYLTELVNDLRTDDRPVLARELRVGPKDDENERFYQAFASLVRLPDEDTSYAAIVLHDITKQKAQEQARVEFISMVSHELRNPLNTLSGFLKVVLQGRAGTLTELQREFLGLADEQSDQLKGRITELLEFNRLEAGRLQLQMDWGSVVDLVLTVYARFQIQAEQSDITIIQQAPDMLPEVLMDSERIGQVLTNLIENAIKATDRGGSIAIGAEVCDTELHVYVDDTGYGIPQEQQEKIFKRFYQLGSKRTQQGVHLGLGLAICQQIVEGHNGRIWVDSEEGKGTRFTFALPLVEREHMLGAQNADEEAAVRVV